MDSCSTSCATTTAISKYVTPIRNHRGSITLYKHFIEHSVQYFKYWGLERNGNVAPKPKDNGQKGFGLRPHSTKPHSLLGILSKVVKFSMKNYLCRYPGASLLTEPNITTALSHYKRDWLIVICNSVGRHKQMTLIGFTSENTFVLCSRGHGLVMFSVLLASELSNECFTAWLIEWGKEDATHIIYDLSK